MTTTPKKHALTTYKKLHEGIYKWLVDVYHQQKHSVINMRPDEMWRISISQEDIRLVSSLEDLDCVFGKSATRQLSHKGIQINSLFYNSVELNELRHRHGATCDVNVLYSEEDLGGITVFVKGDSHSYIVPAVAKEYATGLTAWQHKMNKKWLTKNKLNSNEALLLKAKAEVLNWAGTGKKSAKKARTVGDNELLEISETKPDKKEKTSLLDDAKHIDEVVVVDDVSASFEAIKPVYRPRGIVSNKKEES